MDFGYSRASHSDDDDDSSQFSNNDSGDDEFLNDDDDECNDTMEMTEEELRKLTNEQLKVKLKSKGLPVSGNKNILIDRLLHPNRCKKKPADWKKSKAKALLKKLLQDRESRLHTMTPRQVYESHKWYQDYPFDRFKENVANLKKSIAENFAIVDKDIEIVREELRNFPQSTEGCRGYPRWDKHPAKSLLRKDIEEGKYELGKAKQFQKSRVEYCAFPLTVFRDHIHQERRRQREKPMKVIQRNKKAQKMHLKDVEMMEAIWTADEKYKKDVEEMISAMTDF